MRYRKSGMNEAPTNIELARRKPEKKIRAKPVKSRLDSFFIEVKNCHFGL
jgi:hypothetical protein